MIRFALLTTVLCAVSLVGGTARGACDLDEVDRRERAPIEEVRSSDLIRARAWDCVDAKRDSEKANAVELANLEFQRLAPDGDCDPENDATRKLLARASLNDLIARKAWRCVEAKRLMKRDDDQKIASVEYGRRAASAFGIPAFLARGLFVSGQLGWTNTTADGFDQQGITARLRSSKSTRAVTVGYGDKRLLEDMAVMFNRGPDIPAWVDQAPSGWPMLSVRGLLLKPVTVNAAFKYGRTVDFRGNTTDLDDLTTAKEWSVTARYKLPIDALFGLDYKTE